MGPYSLTPSAGAVGPGRGTKRSIRNCCLRIASKSIRMRAVCVERDGSLINTSGASSATPAAIHGVARGMRSRNRAAGPHATSAIGSATSGMNAGAITPKLNTW